MSPSGTDSAALAFRDGAEIELTSKAGQALGRYFPEIVESLRKLKAPKFVLDGEIIVTLDAKLSFDDLLQRIHPAASRVKKNWQETPVTFVVFDLLVDAKGKCWVEEPLSERRKALVTFAGKYFSDPNSIAISPATPDLKTAKNWFYTMGGGLDGIIAKRTRFAIWSGERHGCSRSRTCVPLIVLLAGSATRRGTAGRIAAFGSLYNREVCLITSASAPVLPGRGARRSQRNWKP